MIGGRRAMTQSHWKEKERKKAHIPKRGRGRRGMVQRLLRLHSLKSMTPQQLYAALQNVREQIASIMTRRRGQRPRRRQQQHQQDQE